LTGECNFKESKKRHLTDYLIKSDGGIGPLKSRQPFFLEKVLNPTDNFRKMRLQVLKYKPLSQLQAVVL